MPTNRNAMLKILKKKTFLEKIEFKDLKQLLLLSPGLCLQIKFVTSNHRESLMVKIKLIYAYCIFRIKNVFLKYNYIESKGKEKN